MKYEITNEVKVIFGRTLHRIKAIKSFANIGKGELGGWIENTDNLSQEGNSWISENGMVFGNARVLDNARICGNASVFDYAQICDNAKVFDYARVWGTASVYGNALICDNARIHNNAQICGYARISGNACVNDRARVFGNASVTDNAKVSGNARVSGNANLRRPNDIIVVGPIGSRYDFTTFYKKSSVETLVNCGCFMGTIEEFEKQVEKTHGDNKYAKVYKKAIELAKLQIVENDN